MSWATPLWVRVLRFYEVLSSPDLVRLGSIPIALWVFTRLNAYASLQILSLGTIHVELSPQALNPEVA
ncbi:hypothetical protein NHH03_17365 [Stieleria sp. TO1_6]|uniref:hypothetical protein n=1 Tax=Stieleria tagensis TaxID=2956795 RepID=UPI00209AA8DD|nr:hypothetical protein [Stieleria tagensis]MCO8123520.1 hypothetical protein [Stieleria tagensis]